METPVNEKRFENAEKEYQASVEKVTDDNEKSTSVHKAAQIAAFKLRAEKSFLQKKQEAMKRWMDKHREESTKTIIKVCNTAKVIVERMAKEKEKEMQEMIAEMDKAHQEELNQIRIETRREALRDFLKINAKFNHEQKEEDRKKSTNTTDTRTLHSLPSKPAQTEQPAPFNKVLQISLEDVLANKRKGNTTTEKKQLCETTTAKETSTKPQHNNNASQINPHDTSAKKAKVDDATERQPSCETQTIVSPAKSMQREVLAYIPHEIPTKKAKLDYMTEKQPFCEVEMCAIRSLNQPRSKQVIIELAKKPRHDVIRILEEERRKALMTEGQSSEKRGQLKENAVCSKHNSSDVANRSSISEESYSLSVENEKLFTCNACGRTDTEMLMCGGCYNNYYCDELCQTRDWQMHQQWCTVDVE